MASVTFYGLINTLSQQLTAEYDRRRVRKAGHGRSLVRPPAGAISFAEAGGADLFGKNNLERGVPDHELVTQSYGRREISCASQEIFDSDFVRRAPVLQRALHAAPAGTARSASQAPALVGLPREYGKLADTVRLFFEDANHDCRDYDRNVFIMVRFQPGNRALSDLDATIRESLRARKLAGHRADDRCYPNDRNVWDNVCTYMFCCKYGVAVLEDIVSDEFNPNVALEYGFMRALGKPTLLLKERRFKPRADILGTLWHEFDILDIRRSVPDALNTWLDDLGVVV